jgi:uncharacterized membrane protein (DUF485 family)
MSAHHESAPVFAKNAATAAVLFMAEIIVSYAAAPVLADDVALGIKLAICLGIVAMWSVFCVYVSKAFEAGYMTIMELAAHPPAPVPVGKPLAKAS